MRNLNNKGFRAFSFTIPSARELLQIFEIAAPVFVTMTSKVSFWGPKICIFSSYHCNELFQNFLQVAFYALLTYSATSMGAVTLAAHQVYTWWLTKRLLMREYLIEGNLINLLFMSYFLKVMINILCMCTVWGEPLSQTAQSFMPELIYGANRNLIKVPTYWLQC